MNERVSRVVCDAGPLIHLSELDSLALLADFDEVLVPLQVWEEVERHQPSALHSSAPFLRKISIDITSQPAFQALVKSLGLELGEQAGLSLMQAYPQAIFLTDDAAARLAAGTLGYQVHGSIGILLRAIRRGQRTREQILSLLRNLPARSTLHIRPTLLQEIIARLENQS